ncbi:hypothetical protein [Stappia sp.]|uniref:hypothetical protein n=1 Tax=Stappia sp. TaxID=1870903 RepID=UPI003D124221
MRNGIPHDDYEAGFAVGWQLLRGTETDVPAALSVPDIPDGSTAFLEGVKDGLNAVPKPKNAKDREENYVEVKACRHPEGEAGCFFSNLYEVLN